MTATELETIAAAQSGDTAARNALIEANVRWLYLMAAKGAGKDDPAEWLSLAVELFIKRIRTFRPEAGANLRTYAGRGICSEIRRERSRTYGAVSRSRRHPSESAPTAEAREASYRVASIHSVDGERAYQIADSRVVDHGQTEQLELLRACIERLPERQRHVIKGRLAERTMRDITERLDLCESMGCRILPEALDRLAEMLGAKEMAA